MNRGRLEIDESPMCERAGQNSQPDGDPTMGDVLHGRKQTSPNAEKGKFRNFDGNPQAWKKRFGKWDPGSKTMKHPHLFPLPTFSMSPQLIHGSSRVHSENVECRMRNEMKTGMGRGNKTN
jgi:hypothetical protein